MLGARDQDSTTFSISMSGGRVSPLLDVATKFLLVETVRSRETQRRTVVLSDFDAVRRVTSLRHMGVSTLICGAVSDRLSKRLSSSGLRLIADTCGPVDEVACAFLGGFLTNAAYLMPGCARRSNDNQ